MHSEVEQHLCVESRQSSGTCFELAAQHWSQIYFEIIKFIYSEKATKIFKIFTLLLSYVVPVKSKVKISQNFVAFSEYMNFMKILAF